MSSKVYATVPVESLVPGQRFTEQGLPEWALDDDDYWYVLQWVNPSNHTFAFHTVVGDHQPGSMPYGFDGKVVVEEQS